MILPALLVYLAADAITLGVIVVQHRRQRFPMSRADIIQASGISALWPVFWLWLAVHLAAGLHLSIRRRRQLRREGLR